MNSSDSELLTMLKENLRIDFDDEDSLLARLLDESVATVCDMTERTIPELVEMGGDGQLPLPVRQAVILLASHRYDESRGGFMKSTLKESPYGIERLLSKYRKLVH